MKTKLLQTGLNLLLVAVCITLVMAYWLRPPLSLPAAQTAALVPATTLGMIGPAEPLTTADVIPFVKTLHIHGIPYEQARQFGPEAVPILLDLLADPINEPYATNIVVTLGFIGHPSARQPLLDYLTQTQGEVSLDQYRALTSVPYALSQLAHQGDISALTFLLQASDNIYWNGQTLPWTFEGAIQTPELYRQTLLSLGVSGLPQAQTRLQEIVNQGGLSAQAENEALQQALALNQQVQQEGMGPVVSPDPSRLVAPAELQGSLGPQAGDANSNTHLQTFTVARHTSTSGIPSNAEVDALLAEASRIMQTADAPADIGCCVSFRRSNAVGTFNVTNGTVNTDSDLNAVFGVSSHQVKIVQNLNFCGGFNTSIIGCAFIDSPKNMVLEYRFNLTQDAILWTHEFGHNQGLLHPNPSIATRIMNGFLTSSAKEVTQSECNAWHSASANPGQVVGPCPLLFKAHKFLASPAPINPGDTITYIILIENNTFAAITNITVADTLPNNTTLVGGATANPPVVDLSNFPNTSPPFTLNSQSTVQVTYAVQVDPGVNSKDLLINTATIDTLSLPQPVQKTHTAIVDALNIYLPIAFK